MDRFNCGVSINTTSQVGFSQKTVHNTIHRGNVSNSLEGNISYPENLSQGFFVFPFLRRIDQDNWGINPDRWTDKKLADDLRKNASPCGKLVSNLEEV